MPTLRDGLLFVRDVVDGLPVVPDGWTVRPEDAGWYTILRPDRTWLAAWRANTTPDGTQALFLVLGPRAILDALAGGTPLRVAWANRGDAATRAVLRRWPTWRCSGFERVSDGEGGTEIVAFAGVRRLIVTEGQALPDPVSDPMPWLFRSDGSITTVQDEAQYRVDAITRPALLATMAGFVDHLDAEETDAIA